MNCDDIDVVEFFRGRTEVDGCDLAPIITLGHFAFTRCWRHFHDDLHVYSTPRALQRTNVNGDDRVKAALTGGQPSVT